MREVWGIAQFSRLRFENLLTSVFCLNLRIERTLDVEPPACFNGSLSGTKVHFCRNRQIITEIFGNVKEKRYLCTKLLKLRHSFLNGHGRLRTVFLYRIIAVFYKVLIKLFPPKHNKQAAYWRVCGFFRHYRPMSYF